MHIASPKDIAYLAFEGGGGKGVTYVGALKALEAMGVLPIDIEKPGKNQIKGISGGSAGAIVALLISMGLNSDDLERILTNPGTFNGFFDRPLIGQSRKVNRQNQPDQEVAPRPSMGLDVVIWSGMVALFALSLKLGAFGPKSSVMVQQLTRYPEGYLYNLLYDRGLFPGFAMRQFLSGMIDQHLTRVLAKGKGNATGADVNFDLFYQMTGVDLVVTGSNLTRHRPGVFSRWHTPKFPVAEAVGISSSYPVFKPVYVVADVPVGGANERVDDYHGLWSDGGLSNNFPLHAFDRDQWPSTIRNVGYGSLNSKMLGLRLTECPPGHSQMPLKTMRSGTLDVLCGHMGDLLSTMLYPAESGQIRSADEEDQTIDLFTYDLETLDFAPSPEKRKRAIEAAENAVKSYFKS